MEPSSHQRQTRRKIRLDVTVQLVAMAGSTLAFFLKKKCFWGSTSYLYV